jgi:hypothetical protein
MSTATTSKIVCDLSISADGCSAGPNQTEERPFGDGDTSLLHAWMFDTSEENRAGSRRPQRCGRRRRQHDQPVSGGGADRRAAPAHRPFILGVGTRLFDGGFGCWLSIRLRSRS